MHIVTGLVVAGLLGRMKKGGAPPGLPQFKTGPVRVAHAIPGRIRFVVPSLRGVAPAGLTWIDDMKSLRGVERVELNTVTGSVVIVYRPKDVEPAQLFGALVRLLGLEQELECVPSPVLVRELREMGKSLNFAVYDKTGGMVDLWTLVLIALAGVGAKKAWDTGWASLPAGFTLMWWALNGVSRRHEDML